MTLAARADIEPPDAPLPGMVGEHRSMREVYALVRRAAPTELPVVVVGQTGTGKELVARAVHELSPRRGGAFIDINCAAIPENLVEGELFGWERGAFSGAERTVPGLLEIADGGTLFLDEACSLSLSVQSKLLRAIELHQHRRVGGRVLLNARSRIVLALQCPLEHLVASGAYHAAFAHRINGVTVTLPPLASRGKDVRRLAEAFLAEVRRANGWTLRWSEEALQQLERMPWPGNVRELRALVSRIPLHVQDGFVSAAAVAASGPRTSPAGLTLAEVEAALARNGGNVSAAARTLGVPRSTLRDRLPKRDHTN